MSTTAPSFLPWDSTFFNCRIGRLPGNRLTPALVDEALAWAAEQQIDCLYLLADLNDAATLALAAAAGFRLVDIRLTLDSRLTSTVCPDGLASPFRLATSTDIADLRAIAAANHTDSRFYFDGNFPREQCNELYATWIEKSCHGSAEAVLVVEHQGRAAGYLSCHLLPDNTGNIGLVGIGPTCQGQGYGRQLLTNALQWFAANGVSRVTVVTQGRNIAAQRLYQQAGFRTCACEAWYHLWPTKQ